MNTFAPISILVSLIFIAMSKRKWATLCATVFSWFCFFIGVYAAMLAIYPKRYDFAGLVAGDIASLLALLICINHSRKTLKSTNSTPVPPAP